MALRMMRSNSPGISRSHLASCALTNTCSSRHLCWVRLTSGLTSHRSDDDSVAINTDEEGGVRINDVGGEAECGCRSSQIDGEGVGLRTVTAKVEVAAYGNIEE